MLSHLPAAVWPPIGEIHTAPLTTSGSTWQHGSCMVTTISSAPPAKNGLLAALPQKEFKRILPDLEPVALSMKDVLYEAFQPIQYVYFPESGLITKVVATEEGA